MCIVHNIGRTIKIKNIGWFHQTINPISEELKAVGKKVFCLEFVYDDVLVKIPRFDKSKIINMGLLWHLLFGKIKSYKKDEVYMPGLDDVISRCKEKGVSASAFSVISLTNKLLAEKEYFMKILKKTKIKLIVISNWRNPVQMGLTMAAKELGIKCIEINHGYFGQHCFTHFGWCKHGKYSFECRPDYYWCWSEKSALVMNEELRFGKAIHGGIPYMLAWKNGLKLKLNNMDFEFKKMISSRKKVVLVTLNSVITKEQYPEWLLDVVKETGDSFFWLFRKHLSDVLSGQDELCEEVELFNNAEWEKSTMAPLFQLLEFTDVHVTYNSSAVIEAEAMGIRSIVLSGTVVGRFEEQINKGHVSYVSTKEDMLNKLLEYSIAKIDNMYQPQGIKELIGLIES